MELENIDINAIIKERQSPEREAKYRALLEKKLATMDDNDPMVRAMKNHFETVIKGAQNESSK